MRNILWIFCVSFVVLAGCAVQRKIMVYEDYTPLPVFQGRTVRMNYNPPSRLCPLAAHSGYVAIVAPIIEKGFRKRGAVIVIENESNYWKRDDGPSYNFEALVCLSRVRGRSSVFGTNLYSYYFRAIVHIRVIYTTSRKVVAASTGESVLSIDGRGRASHDARVFAFRDAAELASRRLE